ncbi:hypothetical protein Kfla_5722 [Kribbella flavida DSM 17836]|uniref:Glutathionylspermidine synthase-like protein n=1 Tax=Kribbella flavida (strain DSM 17836 / JCM 10339 / NBRC 14399) TaxID=479435 RepID=D2PPD1_KRIFD|nr:hypothetical protein [Kribbella flavida]ADB34727.1 hypothetical protein Kfla_5722 [Kribbella flavida DSM 17836]
MSLTDDYLAAAADRGPKASAILAAAAPELDATTYFGRCLSRPVFLEADVYRQLAADLDLLHSALTRLPERVFGGDLAEFARTVGMAETQVQAICRGRGPAPSRMGRADMYRDAQGFHLLEMNMGSTVGGVDNTVLNAAMLQHPFIAEFVDANGLTYRDTMTEVARTILTEAKVPSGVRPVMAIADFPDSYPELERILHKSAAMLAPLGIDALPCPVDALEYRDERIWLGDRQIDVVFRLFMIEDVLKPGAVELLEPVLQAAERGHVAIFTPLDAELYGSKGALALLSDEAYRDRYPADELAALDRILPWTRMVRSGPVTVDGERIDLEQYALANREELVLKPTALHGGDGVLLGWQTEPDVWAAKLSEAMDNPWVLQRRIRPVPEVFPTDDGTEEWLLSWGAILVSDGLGGFLVRGSQQLDGDVVNMSTGATATCCFHQP